MVQQSRNRRTSANRLLAASAAAIPICSCTLFSSMINASYSTVNSDTVIVFEGKDIRCKTTRAKDDSCSNQEMCIHRVVD